MEPLYDPDVVNGIDMPDVAKDGNSCQGYVIASGPTSPFRYPDLVFYRTYFTDNNFRLGREVLTVLDKDIVGYVRDDCLVPRSDSVVVKPDFSEFGRFVKQDVIFSLPQSVRDVLEPPRFGDILAVGEDCVEGIQVGDRVVIPLPFNWSTRRGWGGFELAWTDRISGWTENLYIIPESIIEAKITKCP